MASIMYQYTTKDFTIFDSLPFVEVMGTLDRDPPALCISFPDTEENRQAVEARYREYRAATPDLYHRSM